MCCYWILANNIVKIIFGSVLQVNMLLRMDMSIINKVFL